MPLAKAITRFPGREMGQRSASWKTCQSPVELPNDFALLSKSDSLRSGCTAVGFSARDEFKGWISRPGSAEQGVIQGEFYATAIEFGRTVGRKFDMASRHAAGKGMRSRDKERYKGKKGGERIGGVLAASPSGVAGDCRWRATGLGLARIFETKVMSHRIAKALT